MFAILHFVSTVQDALHRVTAVVGRGGAGGGQQGLAGSSGQTGADQRTDVSHSVQRRLSSPVSGTAGPGPQGLCVCVCWRVKGKGTKVPVNTELIQIVITLLLQFKKLLVHCLVRVCKL